MTHSNRRTLFLTTALFAAFAGISAYAQDAAPQTGDDQSQDVTVTAKRLEKTARSEQKAALNIINIQPAETIEKYPDFNAAEALGRVVGVSMSEDTGEGRFVEIRGIDGNLNGATFGGVVLLNTNPGGTYFGGGGRAVEMDTVPIGAIDRVEVIKSLRPDLDAEGLGGIIELTPRSAATLKKPFLDATLAGGYEALRGDYKPFRAEIATGFRSGALSAIFTASQFNNNQAIDDVEEDYIDAGKTYDDLQLRHYDYHRRRFGYGTELDYQPDANSSYYLRANVAGYTESVLKRHEVLNGLGDDTTTNGNVITATGASLQLKTTDEQESHRNAIFATGGVNRFDGMTLDYQLSYSRSTFDVDYNYGGTLNSDTDYTIAYDNSGDGNRPTFQVVSGGSINDPAQYYLKKLTNSQEKDVDSETGAQVNLAMPMHWVGDDELKIGLRLRDRAKTAGNGSVTYATTKQTLNSLSPQAPYEGFYDGAYTTGPFPDLSKLRDIANAQSSTAPITLDNLFDDNEKISAGYAQYSTRNANWSFLGGLRVEKTDGTYRYNQTVDDVTGRVERKKSYTNFFPSAQLRYQWSDNLIGRVSYSTGIGRPGFNQLSSDATVDTNAMTVESGNPDLKPTTGSNVDATIEWYLPGSGILQFGLFDKQFDNYIVTRERKGTFDGDSGYTFVSYYNISGAWARGLEAAYSQKFTGLPGVWSGLGLDANLTLVDSQAELRDGDKRTLPGTSHATANLAVFYEKNRLSLRLASEYVGKTLFGAGDDRSSDLYQNGRLTADAFAGWDINPRWNLYLKVKNLTNEKLRFYIGDTDRPVQREFYDQSYEFGIRAKF